MRTTLPGTAEVKGQCSVTIRRDTMQVIEELVVYAQKHQIAGQNIPLALYSRKQVVETAVCYLASVIAAHLAPDAALAARLLQYQELWAQQGVTQGDLAELVRRDLVARDEAQQARNAVAIAEPSKQ